MPFTFAHPAIVLPLTSLPARYLSLTGLVIGSLTPDFEYFLRMGIEGHLGHTLSGIVLFNLPIGLILTFIFHNLVRNSLFKNLPTPLSSRLLRFTTFDWNAYFRSSWIVVIISLVIGAASHIFWDGFTHRDGLFVERIQFLSETVAFLSFKAPVFQLLQHGSTLLGFTVIGYAIYKLPPTEHIDAPIRPAYWMTLVGIGSTVLLVRVATGFNDWSLANVVVNLISAGMISLALTPLFFEQRDSAVRRS